MIELFIVEVVQELFEEKDPLGTELKYVRSSWFCYCINYIPSEIVARNRVFDWIVLISFLSDVIRLFYFPFVGHYFIIMTIDVIVCFIFFAFFIHGTWPCCIYGHWTENQSRLSSTMKIGFSWKWSIPRQINETHLFFVYSFNLQYDQLIEASTIVARKRTPVNFLPMPICFSVLFSIEISILLCVH